MSWIAVPVRKVGQNLARTPVAKGKMDKGDCCDGGTHTQDEPSKLQMAADGDDQIEKERRERNATKEIKECLMGKGW